MILVPGFEVADVCGDCASQCDLAQQFLALDAQSKTLQDKGERGMSGDSFNIHKLTPNGIEIVEVPEEREAALQHYRVQLSQELNSVDTQKEALRRRSALLSRACSGVLRMRATRDNTEYTVTLCTSAITELETLEGKSHVPVHLKTRIVPSPGDHSASETPLS